jgi:hypothetical protein
LNKLILGLAALALPTAALADHYDHNRYQHNYQRYEQRYHQHRNNGFHFGIILNAPRYDYVNRVGYYGIVYPTAEGYVGCEQYGRDGLLVNRYGRLIRNYEFFTRANVHCETRY